MRVEVKLAWTYIFQTEAVDFVITIRLVIDSFWKSNDKGIAFNISITIEYLDIDDILFCIGNSTGSIKVAVEDGRVGSFWEFIIKNVI